MGFLHFSYIDPGAGSMVLQILVGGFLGAVYVGRRFLSQLWARIASALKRPSKSKTDKGEAGDQL